MHIVLHFVQSAQDLRLSNLPDASAQPLDVTLSVKFRILILGLVSPLPLWFCG